MTYHSSTHASTHAPTRTTGVDRAIASILVAGVAFVLGYTVVRAGLAQSEASVTATDSNTVQMAIPGEGTLWKDFGPSF